MEAPHIGYVNVFVTDLEQAMRFYGETLGLELAHGDPAHGYASYRAGPVQLGLARIADDSQSSLVGRHTGVGLCVPDLDAAHHVLAGRGVHFEMEPSHQAWGGYLALIADPDGNLLYLDQPEHA